MALFPHIETADENGVLAISEGLDPDVVIEAYCRGIFPWPYPNYEYIPWFAPDPRAILPFDNIYISKRMKRYLFKSSFTFRLNTNFPRVMEECSLPVNRKKLPKDKSTYASWITPEMKETYSVLHEWGYCQSVEVYKENSLVGGIYGVSIGHFFSADSMFYRIPNASKAAIYMLIAVLKHQGVRFIDCQEINEHTESLGAVEIPRSRFMELQGPAIRKADLDWRPRVLSTDLMTIL